MCLWFLWVFAVFEWVCFSCLGGLGGMVFRGLGGQIGFGCGTIGGLGVSVGLRFLFWVKQILGLYGGFWVAIVFGELGSLPILWVLCSIDSHEFGGFWFGMACLGFGWSSLAVGFWKVGLGCLVCRSGLRCG